jgi:intracellular sulfur oxidation DsrE/DsrF family protein
MNDQKKALHIDIPVELKELRLYSALHRYRSKAICPRPCFTFTSSSTISPTGRQSQVVAVFHTNAGQVTLHDQAYNADRNIATGDPYRQLVTDLMERGVQVELCGATAKAHGRGHADLIPRIKIDTDAMARTTQLVQEGFVT